jgi:hypothetical protein
MLSSRLAYPVNYLNTNRRRYRGWPGRWPRDTVGPKSWNQVRLRRQCPSRRQADARFHEMQSRSPTPTA